MIKPEFGNTDEALEYAAQLIEETSFTDLRGMMGKRKRDREDWQVRFTAIEDTRRECASHIRAFKDRPDLDAKSVLRRIASKTGPSQMLHLMDAWPLAWKGWLTITATINCTSNSCPPETEYRIELTDAGREILDAPNSAAR